ncbi:FHA domain-containing protein [Micromonospora chokoriensis]|uniref:FHA domain-containing protein n=1 Tax=Micromonospora chokoriensis TaxID=356851 RepID=UPI000A06E985|nr:FHA domain-containing protein [Micromonospora chokoriensis]
MRSPTVIIDLSPVVRDQNLNDWGLVEKIVRAWRAQRDNNATFYGVADNSLWHCLDEVGKRALSDWKKRKIARSVPFADPDIIELAEQHPHAVVITRDLYRDLRRDHPWLQGSDRFFSPVYTDGKVSFEQLVMAPIDESEMSMRVEAGGLKPRGLASPEARQVLDSEWACVNPGCVWGGLPVIDKDPYYRDGVVRCPDCGEPVNRVGAIGHTRGVVVFLGTEEIDRFAVAEGRTIVVGRARGEDRYCVRDVLEAAQFALVSRDHLAVSNVNGDLFVEDLGSKNGTKLSHDGTTTALEPSVRQRVLQGARISLAKGALQIRRSGRKRVRARWDPDLATPPWANPNREHA